MSPYPRNPFRDRPDSPLPIRTFGAALVMVLLNSAFSTGAEPGERPQADGLQVSAPDNGALIQRLKRTNLLNAEEVVDRLALVGHGATERQGGNSPPPKRDGFLTPSPFEPQYRESYASLATLRHPLPRNP